MKPKINIPFIDKAMRDKKFFKLLPEKVQKKYNKIAAGCGCGKNGQQKNEFLVSIGQEYKDLLNEYYGLNDQG